MSNRDNRPTLDEIRNSSIGNKYNVEFEMGNGECMTFSGKLLVFKGAYFGFDVDGNIAWIHRNRLIWMLPIHDRKE